MKASMLIIAGVAAITATSASAHHSAAVLDESKTVKVTGVVSEWHLINPHARLVIAVTDAGGQKVLWTFEGGRAGGGGDSENAKIRKDTFKPGDKVTVSTHAHRHGRPVGRLGQVDFADGRPSVCVLRPCDGMP
jgi:Family of unknown function (DUF6152)